MWKLNSEYIHECAHARTHTQEGNDLGFLKDAIRIASHKPS